MTPECDPSPLESNPPMGRGWQEGSWYVEEFSNAARLGIRVRTKLHEERTAFQKITLYQTDFFGRVLTLDDLVMCTERDEFVYHEMITHVPLCSHPEPRTVLVVGGGDCGAAREVLKHPCVERIVQCEIDRRVTDLCLEYFPWVRSVMDDRRLELVFEDGLEYVEKHEAGFDAILIDSTDPVGPAAGLFQKDFYREVLKALRPGGLMAAQTESPHWSPRTFATIHENLRAVFPAVRAYWGAVPTYPSGSWTWALAGGASRGTSFDPDRCAAVSASCLYYNESVHQACFALPGFIQAALTNENVFGRFTGG